jgi:glutamine synthetase
VSREGTRLFNNLGQKIKSMTINIGLEQEFFVLTRDQFYRRPDLQFTGRTVMEKCLAVAKKVATITWRPSSLGRQY